jgi:hypothetical protein
MGGKGVIGGREFWFLRKIWTWIDGRGRSMIGVVVDLAGLKEIWFKCGGHGLMIL